MNPASRRDAQRATVERIIQERHRRGLNQQQFADLLGLNRLKYNRIETQASPLKIEIARKIETALGLDLNMGAGE